MKYVVSSSLLYSRLQTLGKIIPSKLALPVLSNFSFEVSGNELQVTASDGETTIRTRLEIQETGGSGRFMLEAGRLVDILKQIPDQPLTIEVDPSTYQVEVKYQNGHMSFQGENGEGYPNVQAAQEGEPQVVKIAEGSKFGRGIGSALTAVADKDSGRRVMNGVYTDVMPGEVALVASDGHKLVRYTLKCDREDLSIGFTFPQKPATLLRQVAEAVEGEVSLTLYGRKQAVVVAGDYEIICRLIEDAYPNYKSVIPQKNENVAQVDRGALVNALRRMVALAPKNGMAPMVKFSFNETGLCLTVGNVEYSMYGEETLVCSYEGAPLTIGFNAQDLITLLSNVTTSDVTIKLADAVKAGLILPLAGEGEEDGGELLILLMPILINS